MTAPQHARLSCDPHISNLDGFGPKHISLCPLSHALAHLWPRTLSGLLIDRRLRALVGQNPIQDTIITILAEYTSCNDDFGRNPVFTSM